MLAYGLDCATRTVSRIALDTTPPQARLCQRASPPVNDARSTHSSSVGGAACTGAGRKGRKNGVPNAFAVLTVPSTQSPPSAAMACFVRIHIGQAPCERAGGGGRPWRGYTGAGLSGHGIATAISVPIRRSVSLFPQPPQFCALVPSIPTVYGACSAAIETESRTNSHRGCVRTRAAHTCARLPTSPTLPPLDADGGSSRVTVGILQKQRQGRGRASALSLCASERHDGGSVRLR